MKGILQWVLVAVVVVAVVLVVAVYMFPEVASRIPGIGDVVRATTQEVYFANVDYEIRGIANWTWVPTTVIEIKNTTTTLRLIPLSIGPFFDIEPIEIKGKVVITAVNSNGVETGRFSRDYDVSTGWFQFSDTVVRTTDSVKLGPAGSGTYTITVTAYTRDGAFITEDHTTRTIQEG